MANYLVSLSQSAPTFQFLKTIWMQFQFFQKIKELKCRSFKLKMQPLDIDFIKSIKQFADESIKMWQKCEDFRDFKSIPLPLKEVEIDVIHEYDAKSDVHSWKLVNDDVDNKELSDIGQLGAKWDPTQMQLECLKFDHTLKIKEIIGHSENKTLEIQHDAYNWHFLQQIFIFTPFYSPITIPANYNYVTRLINPLTEIQVGTNAFLRQYIIN